MFTPKKRAQNLNFMSMSLKVTLVIRGNHSTKPTTIENTAPIDNTK